MPTLSGCFLHNMSADRLNHEHQGRGRRAIPDGVFGRAEKILARYRRLPSCPFVAEIIVSNSLETKGRQAVARSSLAAFFTQQVRKSSLPLLRRSKATTNHLL